jgi:Mlc titration factor MtfA (ptsG expression regulator)
VRAVRPSALVVPLLWGALPALLLGLAAYRVGGAPAGAGVGLGLWIVVALVALRGPLRRLRAARQRLPEAHRAWLAGHVPLYAALAADARAQFEHDVRLLLSTLRFEATDGVDLTDELRLAVAAGGATLLHGRPDWDLPTDRTVLFVPGAFDEAYGEEEAGVYDGMVHTQGPVVLSARAALDGWARADGQNVVLHELAHLFDLDGTGADGLPTFLDRGSVDAWARLARDEMRKAAGGRSVLRSYAAHDRAELFAVATEQFFERPARLRSRHPELYAALRAFYNLDPPDEAVPEDAGSLMARRWDE